MQKKRKLGSVVAVVGAGMSKFGMFNDKDSKEVFAEAFREMLASGDKGVDPNDIDGLYLGNFSNDFFIHKSHWDQSYQIRSAFHLSQQQEPRVLAPQASCFPGRRFCHSLGSLRYGAGKGCGGNVKTYH